MMRYMVLTTGYKYPLGSWVIESVYRTVTLATNVLTALMVNLLAGKFIVHEV